MSYIKQLSSDHNALQKSIALVDCNTFYASCERIFNPKLIGKPIVVLSNNDGCIITRSSEAKALGIKMGEPYFKAKKVIEQNNVKVFSSNYALYGDISQRVMEILANFSPEIEIYSIDEAFLDLQGFNNYELKIYSEYIIKKIKKWVGIPVSVGIGSTKTLSKIANHLAKKNKYYKGICILKQWPEIKQGLMNTRIEDVWGIGRRLSSMLKKYSINNAYDFINTERAWIKKKMGVVGEKIYLELRGISCLDLDLIPSDKKSCCVSRSFSHPIEKIEELEEVVAKYASRVAEKIREEGLSSESMNIFILTNYFNKRQKQYSNSIKLQFPYPTNSNIQIIKHSLLGLRKIYRKGYVYKKAGVVLHGLSDSSSTRGLLDYDKEVSDSIMNTMDKINFRYGNSTLKIAAEGMGQKWKIKKEKLSPNYTTSFKDLVIVKC